MDTKLNRLSYNINLDIFIVGLFLIWLIDLLSIAQLLLSEKWKIPSYKLYDYKHEPIHTISYELHHYMPCNIVALLIQFMMLVFHASL